jgi:uncharacterized protein YjdB
MKTLSIILITLCLLMFVACSGGHSNTAQANSPTLSALTVTPGSASITDGGNQQFTATGKFSDGTSSDMTNSVQWASANTNVASVSTKGVATAMGVGDTTITASSGTVKGSATIDVTSSGASLQAIAISPTGASVPANTSQQFSATGSYSDGSSRDITAIVTWNSSLSSVATITTNGLLTGVSAGSTTVSAILGGITQSTNVTVTAPTISFITVTPVGLTLPIGVNQQYVATATYTDGTSQDLVSGVNWSSSTTSVASISGSGLATTIGAGTTTIVATAGGSSDSVTLTVVAAHLTSISVLPATPTIALGTTQQFTATGSFDDGSTQLLTSVTWSSSANNVGKIDASSGVAAAVGTGNTTISASVGSVSGSTVLTVSGANLVSIAITPANSSMAIGASTQLTATGTFSDSSTQDLTSLAAWSTSNPAIATVSQTGAVTSISSGSIQISAYFSGITGTTGLTVTTAHLVSIAIIPTNPRMAAGTSMQLHAQGTFSDGSTTSNLSGLTWKSSKPNIASVRSTGIVHAKKSGSVTISAKASGVTGTTTVTVGTGTLVSVALTPANPTVSLGTNEQFAATGSFSDGTTQDITVITHWSSSSQSVATIANAPSVAGLATTVGKGNTVVGANSGGVTSSTIMTVQ